MRADIAITYQVTFLDEKGNALTARNAMGNADDPLGFSMLYTDLDQPGRIPAATWESAKSWDDAKAPYLESVEILSGVKGAYAMEGAVSSTVGNTPYDASADSSEYTLRHFHGTQGCRFAGAGNIGSGRTDSSPSMLRTAFAAHMEAKGAQTIAARFKWTGTFCGTSIGLPVPGNATRLEVSLHDLATGKAAPQGASWLLESDDGAISLALPGQESTFALYGLPYARYTLVQEKTPEGYHRVADEEIGFSFEESPPDDVAGKVTFVEGYCEGAYDDEGLVLDVWDYKIRLNVTGLVEAPDADRTWGQKFDLVESESGKVLGQALGDGGASDIDGLACGEMGIDLVREPTGRGKDHAERPYDGKMIAAESHDEEHGITFSLTLEDVKKGSRSLRSHGTDASTWDERYSKGVLYIRVYFEQHVTLEYDHTFDDGSNLWETRPSSIEVTARSDAQWSSRKTLSVPGSGTCKVTCSWPDARLHDTDGGKIAYSIDELEIAPYQTTVSQFTAEEADPCLLSAHGVSAYSVEPIALPMTGSGGLMAAFCASFCATVMGAGHALHRRRKEARR